MRSGCGETYHCSHDEILRGVNQTDVVSVDARRGCSGRGGMYRSQAESVRSDRSV